VECSSCGHKNREGARFCAQCATPLTGIACPRCGAPVESGDKFCDACGHDVAAPGDATVPHDGPAIQVAEAVPASRSALEGERKEVTVLFADVKGSMGMVEHIDPELWRRIMNRFFALMCEGVERFGGQVNKFTGDGVMALFGVPTAHEDHADRACHAALHLRDELFSYADELEADEGLEFCVRMGLNSGEVVAGAIGDDLHFDYTAVGHSVGLGKRIEELAEPDTIYLTENTASLVSASFRLRETGTFDIKGIANAVPAYELLGAGSSHSLLDAPTSMSASRFVGRTEELTALEVAFEHVWEGSGQVVGVVCEAGVGKTRLCYEFARRCRERDVEVFEGHALSHSQRIPLHPVQDLLTGYFEIEDGASDTAIRDAVRTKLLSLDDAFDDVLPVLFDFLGAPDPEHPSPGTHPDARQRQLFAAIRRLIHASSRDHPSLILIEDVHSLDGASEAFIKTLVEALPGTRAMLLVNFRPGYHATWMRKSYYRQVPLLPLGESAATELLRGVLGEDPSLEDSVEFLRGRAGGNPFFIEQLVQGLVDAGAFRGERGAYVVARPLHDVELPPTVKALLSARIDRLPPLEKEVLQVAAVIGKRFTEQVLAIVTGSPQDRLSDALRGLTEGEFVYEHAMYPEPQYAFGHPLTEEVAYRSQLADRRRKVHGAVAAALIETYPERGDESAGVIAHHWEQAGEALQAAIWYRRAALWAGQLHPVEALRHWRKVRALLERVPASDQASELRMGAAYWILLFGWRVGMPPEEVDEVFEEGKGFARSGDASALAALTGAYGSSKGFSGAIEEALRYTGEAVRLARDSGNPELEISFFSTSAYWEQLAGRMNKALAIAEETIERTRDDWNIGRTTLGFSVHIFNIRFRAELLAQMGHLDESRRELERAVKLSEEHAEMEILGWAHGNYSTLGWFSGDPDLALDHARKGVEIAERLGSWISHMLAYGLLGMALTLKRKWDDAILAFETALDAVRARQTGLQYAPLWLAWLSSAQLGSGDARAAQSSAEEGVATARTQGAKFWELATQRALARALLRGKGPAPIERTGEVLERAMSLVYETGAMSYEPLIRLELAEFARLTGDERSWERELRRAYRTFKEMGAAGHAAALESEFAELGVTLARASR
jgi:class 3 adenylate cyclase/tetratricopeptide (TPR) repeat protein